MDIDKILNKDTLTKEEIVFLLNLENPDEIELLFEKSKGIRNLYLGRNKRKILSIQFSNHCELSCIYCDLRCDNDRVKRFRLDPEEILHHIKSIFDKGITNIILQSGKDDYYDTDMIAYIIYKIKKSYDVEITLDLLQRGFDEYRAWKFSGADNYLLKFNTSNYNNFSLFTKENSFDDRVNHLKYLKRLGYKICTGNIIGLPNQTITDIAVDLKILESLKPEMIFNTPFIPQKFTEYENFHKGDFLTLLKATAISRILLKKSQIIVTASNNIFMEEEKKHLFEIGADTLLLEPLLNGELKTV